MGYESAKLLFVGRWVADGQVRRAAQRLERRGAQLVHVADLEVEGAADAEPRAGVEAEQLAGAERRLLPRLLAARAVEHPQRIGRRVAVALGDDAQVEARLGRAALAGLEPLRDAVGLPAGQHALLLRVGGRHVRRVRIVGLNQRADALAAKVDGRPGPQRVRDPRPVGVLELELAGGAVQRLRRRRGRRGLRRDRVVVRRRRDGGHRVGPVAGDGSQALRERRWGPHAWGWYRQAGRLGDADGGDHGGSHSGDRRRGSGCGGGRWRCPRRGRHDSRSLVVRLGWLHLKLGDRLWLSGLIV